MFGSLKLLIIMARFVKLFRITMEKSKIDAAREEAKHVTCIQHKCTNIQKMLVKYLDISEYAYNST